MSDALIGHTGFVGGNLAAQHRFAACFNSKNIEAIRGQSFGRLVVSGMPAAKWIANRDPVGDRAVLDRLWNCLSACRAETVVVISTVDVYPAPFGTDEDTVIEPVYQQTYGMHRYRLERLALARFPRVLSVRLPGLYGAGLKKNALFDLIHNRQTHSIPGEGQFQFYNLKRLWRDIDVALAAGLTLMNLATEPLTVREIARHAFGREFTNQPGGLPPRYDMRTKHARLYGGHGGYLESREQVLAGLRAFVAAERRSLTLQVAA
jgi:nucleoside-diphosphate-sugar epimerase